MRSNGGGKCSGTVAMSFRGEIKGPSRHVSIPTLKSVMELRKSV